MNNRTIWFGAAVLMAGLAYLVYAQNQPVAPTPAKPVDPALKTHRQQVSYWIGYATARQMGPEFKYFDLDAMLMGMKDVRDNHDPRLEMEQVQKAMVTFQAEIQADAAKAGQINKQAGEKFLAENAKKPGVKTTKSGLQYKILKAGDGPSPKPTDIVKVHYEGKLLDGTVFDSSYKRNEPATFPVNKVIPGWTEAMQLMKVGSKYQLFIPADLAYGERGAGGQIGPNATLIFTVELLGIEQAPPQLELPMNPGQ